MKLVAQYLKDAGTGYFPLLSMFIFIVVFAVVVYMVFKADKNRLEQNSKMPLED